MDLQYLAGDLIGACKSFEEKNKNEPNQSSGLFGFPVLYP